PVLDAERVRVALGLDMPALISVAPGVVLVPVSNSEISDPACNVAVLRGSCWLMPPMPTPEELEVRFITSAVRTTPENIVMAPSPLTSGVVASKIVLAAILMFDTRFSEPTFRMATPPKGSLTLKLRGKGELDVPTSMIWLPEPPPFT